MGFAWLALGNAGITMSIPMRLAPYTGAYGLSFVFAMMAAALALVAQRRPRVQLAWLLMLPLVALLPRLPDARRGAETALLVQPNISETESWTTESADRMKRDLIEQTVRGTLASSQPPTLVVWPEVPAPLYEEDQRFRAYTYGLARRIQANLLLGVVAHTPTGAPLNSAMLLSPEGTVVSRYD